MAGRILFTAAGGVGAYSAYRYNTEEGFERTIKLWGSLGPTVAHYRFLEAKHKFYKPESDKVAEEEWNELHEKYCDETVETLRQLQGMYTKYGQICAGLTDTFPKVWIDKLRTLEDKVPAQPKEVVFRTISEDYGKDASEVFSEFADTPLGSASIGQVHRARLRSDGSEVAVKVQYPHSLRLFTGDMNTIRSFMEIAAPEQVITLTEMEMMFKEEFDYQAEAKNLIQVHSNMSKAGYVPSIAAVPLPREEFCSKRVLVMDMLKGRKLVDGIREYVAVVAAKEGKTVEQFEKEMTAQIEMEGLPPAYQGPSQTQISLFRNYLKLYDLSYNSGVFLYNNLLGWTGAIDKIDYSESKIPVNTPALVEDLMKIHATQLFRDGCFNADPHAGNFMMLQDDRIGLIDFGATKRLTRGERLTACAIYAALKRKDKKMIKDISMAGGYKSKYNKMENIFSLVEFGFDSFGRDVTGGKNIQQFTDELYKDDPWEEVAGNLVMAQFLSIRLRSMMMQMGHPVRMSHYWGDVAEQVLKEEGCPYETWNEDFAREIMKDDVRMVSGKSKSFF